MRTNENWIPAAAGMTRSECRIPVPSVTPTPSVIPAQAGIQSRRHTPQQIPAHARMRTHENWIPAFAGMARSECRIPVPSVITPTPSVIPAQAGIQARRHTPQKIPARARMRTNENWIPASAGMTRSECRIPVPSVTPTPSVIPAQAGIQPRRHTPQQIPTYARITRKERTAHPASRALLVNSTSSMLHPERQGQRQ